MSLFSDTSKKKGSNGPSRPEACRFVVQDAGSERFLYDSARDEVHVLNRTGKFIHDLCLQGMAAGEIEEALRSEFRLIERQDITGHVSECIEAMKRKGIL